tara:strand:- start:1280 stop:1858 length:579 start_codon:yes stop_codon:yes gene_type:complete
MPSSIECVASVFNGSGLNLEPTPARYMQFEIKNITNEDVTIHSGCVIPAINYATFSNYSRFNWYIPISQQSGGTFIGNSNEYPWPETPFIPLTGIINNIGLVNSVTLSPFGSTNQVLMFKVLFAPNSPANYIHNAELVIKYSTLNSPVLELNANLVGIVQNQFAISEFDWKSYPEIVFSINGIETNNIFSFT